MKISDILSFMQLQYVLRGNTDYNENISLNDLDAEWISEKPTDEAFHIAALQYASLNQIREFSIELQNHIDIIARNKNYDNGFACASYANSTNATWKQEAEDFIAWRDSCWQYAIDVQNDVESGSIETPTLEDFITNAPTLNWS